MTHRVKKTVRPPQVQFTNNAVDMPVVMRRQMSTADEVQKMVETPRIQFIDKVVSAPVVMPLQTPMIQKVLKTLESRHVQFINRVVQVPLATQKCERALLDQSAKDETSLRS